MRSFSLRFSDAVILAASNPGSAYVIYGKASAFSSTLDVNTLTGTTGFRIYGPSANLLAFAVSFGDINADGLQDVIVSGKNDDTAVGTDSGQAYVVYGRSGAAPFTHPFNLNSLDGTNGFKIPGGVAGEKFGTSVEFVGDVNADGGQ
eukprot:2898183-Rhodomonas_salina.1